MNTRFAAVVFTFLILAIAATLPLMPNSDRTTDIAQTDTTMASPIAYQTAPTDSIAGITIACLILGAAVIGRIFFAPNRKAARKPELMSAFRAA